MFRLFSPSCPLDVHSCPFPVPCHVPFIFFVPFIFRFIFPFNVPSFPLLSPLMPILFHFMSPSFPFIPLHVQFPLFPPSIHVQSHCFHSFLFLMIHAPLTCPSFPIFFVFLLFHDMSPRLYRNCILPALVILVMLAMLAMRAMLWEREAGDVGQGIEQPKPSPK